MGRVLVRNWRPGLASGCHWTWKIDTRDPFPFPLWWFQDSYSDLPFVSESHILSSISDYLLKPHVLYELARSYSKCGHGPRPVCKLSLVCDEISRQVESKQFGNTAWPWHPRVWRWPHLVAFAWCHELCPTYVQWDHMWNKMKTKRNKYSSQVMKVSINGHK